MVILMRQNQWSQNPQSNYDRSNLLTNVTILALTVGIFFLNQRNVQLNTRNVQLNTMNVESNKKSAESNKQMLEVLKQINEKFDKEKAI